MNELFEGVNWIAVIIGFVLSYLLGWLWYGPKLFGKTWAEGVGVSLVEGGELPAGAMIAQAFATFGLAWLIGIAVGKAALFTILLILGTLMLFVVSSGKYAKKSNAAVVIEASYMAAMGVVMVVCQGIF